MRGLGSNLDAQAIVRAIVSLGAGLGVTITAEGVETEDELSCLRAEGCHEGQGFLFSRARPNAEIVGLLKAQSSARILSHRNPGGEGRAGGVKYKPSLRAKRNNPAFPYDPGLFRR